MQIIYQSLLLSLGKLFIIRVMKGLIISLSVFVLYAVSTIIVSHIRKPERHSCLLFGAVAAWTPAYFIVFFLTPCNLYFLPQSWIAMPMWLDIAYGYAVFLLNCHSFIDFFYGFNGGFSMSLMLDILRSKGRGISSEDIIEGYRVTDGMDKIYGWRLPHLEQTGYIRTDPRSSACCLTAKGRIIAKVALFFKRFLNLDIGG